VKLICALLLIACSSPSLAAEEATVSFSGDVLPILLRECSFCHMREDRYGYLALDAETAYGNLVDVPAWGFPALKRVEPGQPEASYLWLKLTGAHLRAGGKGWSMPYYPMGDEQRVLVRDWILQGAQDN
jgi:hypothetical protein